MHLRRPRKHGVAARNISLEPPDGSNGISTSASKVREEFKDLKVSDFRTKAARGLRDAAYARNGIAFLHQASRYRGKANYRDAIFLAYGSSVPTLLTHFVDDMLVVLKAFTAMAGAFCSIRVGRGPWAEFVDDLERKRAVSVSPRDIW
jgi:hypothetical protein